MQNASDALQDLRDVHMPDPISWWPPAFGWWMIMGLLILGGGLIFWAWAHRIRTRPRRLALAHLKKVKQQYAAKADDHWAITQLSHLVRRMALATFPRSRVAGLSGQSWLSFLDTTGHTNLFSDGPGQSLCSGPYQPHGMHAAAEVIPLIERWIQQVEIPSRKSWI